jgi:hypothetical protein
MGSIESPFPVFTGEETSCFRVDVAVTGGVAGVGVVAGGVVAGGVVVAGGAGDAGAGAGGV